MNKKFYVGQLIKLKNDHAYTPRYNNKNKQRLLPVAGMIVHLKVEDWVHPYYGMSKHFEQKESMVEVATIKWFEYNIPEVGSSDSYNITIYNEQYHKVPTRRLSDFNNYIKALKKKKELYK